MSILEKCKQLIVAYNNGLLGDTTMPEDTHPPFDSDEQRLIFFTLPMALNYQRNSFALRKSATETMLDTQENRIFNIEKAATADISLLQRSLGKYKIALQPNRHIAIRHTIAKTIHTHRGSVTGLLKSTNYDVLQLQQVIQKEYKKGFPYLSGPKIFHYRLHILGEYGNIELKNKEYINIAPDTHVIKCSIKLGVITEEESKKLSRNQISDIRRNILQGSGISPIDMHSPLWFWSKNDFIYTL